MHRSTFRLALTATALLAATATFAMAAPGDEAPKKERRVEVHKLGGPEQDVFFAALPGDLFGGRGTTLGVAFVPLTAELRQHFGAPEDAGVMVSKVIADSPAQAAGIEVGDIITKVDGKAVTEDMGLGQLIHARKAGETVAIEVLREGRSQTLNATLKESEDLPMLARRVLLQCKDENGSEKDCPGAAAWLGDVDCGEDGKCEIKVICKDGGCSCTINGEDKPCPEGVGKAAGR
jgi:hypothetical protein